MPPRRLLSAVRHPISQNAMALYGVQVVITFLPLITLPWLARVLGPSELGMVIFVQSFSFLLGMLIEYGFGLSATRRIARERDDPEAMATTVAGVLGAKLGLISFAAAAALVALVAVPEFRADPRLVAFGFVMAVLQGLNSSWFFAGLERLRTLALIEVTIRTLTAAAIVLLVRERGDGLLVLWIWTVGAVVAVAVLTVLLYRQVPFRAPASAASRDALRVGWPLFMATGAVALYTTGTVFLLGLVVSSAQLAVFAAAERVARAAMRVVGPVGAATFPRVNYLLESRQDDRAQRLASIALVASTGLALLAALLLIVLAPLVVRVLLGPGFEEAVPILRTLALLLPAVAIGGVLSGQWLLPRGMDRVTSRMVIAAGLANVPLTLGVGSLFGGLGVAVSLVALEVCVALGFAVVVWRSGLAPTRVQALGR